MITYTTNQFGLRQKDVDFMLRLFEGIPAIEKVLLFGSRATGRYEHGSDIDLAICGESLTPNDISHIHHILENDSPTLLWFDIIHYDALQNDKLKYQIATNGKVIFER